MKSNEVPPELAAQYQDLLKLLGSTLRYLERLNVDPNLLKSYKKLVRYLRTRHTETVAEIIGSTSGKIEIAAKTLEQERSDQEILAFTAKEIIDLASNPMTSRKFLERIATLRFGVTRGGLSALRNRDALVEKLRTLIANEGAHDSIARVAGRDRSDDDGPRE